MKKKLKEIAGLEVTGGQIIQRVIADLTKNDQILDSKRKTIVAKTISEGLIEDDGIVFNDYKTLFDDKKLTQEGDVVIKLSPPYNAAIIDKEHKGMLISSFCAVIRNIKNIDKRYLVAFLNSDVAQKQLKNSVLGSTMGILSSGKIYDLEIPIPSVEVQNSIGDYFEKTIKNRVLIQKIMKLEEEKLAALIASVED